MKKPLFKLKQNWSIFLAEINRQGTALLEAEQRWQKKKKKLGSEKLALDQTIICKTREDAEQVSAELERHKMLEAERHWAEKNAALIYNATARLSF